MTTDSQDALTKKSKSVKYGLPIALAIASGAGITYAGHMLNKQNKDQLNPDLTQAIAIMQSTEYQTANKYMIEGNDSQAGDNARILYLQAAEYTYRFLLPRCPKNEFEVATRCRDNLTEKIVQASSASTYLQNKKK